MQYNAIKELMGSAAKEQKYVVKLKYRGPVEALPIGVSDEDSNELSQYVEIYTKYVPAKCSLGPFLNCGFSQTIQTGSGVPRSQPKPHFFFSAKI